MKRAVAERVFTHPRSFQEKSDFMLIGHTNAAMHLHAFATHQMHGVETDLLFPLWQQREIADGLDNGSREVQFHALKSIQGHDAFLVDMDRFRPLICDFFNCSMNQPEKLRSI